VRVGGEPNSRSKLRNQHSSTTILATPQYSTSALEREMVVCRLEDQEMRFFTQINSIPGRRPAGVETACPICIGIGNKRRCRSGRHMQAHSKSSFDVSQNTLKNMQVASTGSMHVDAYLLNNIQNVKTSEGKILKRPS
jgi:hypothetical protein